MAVTDCLTGYEIKSDLDNYQRLGRQIKAYDRFFEQCYIVVGRHLQSAERKVPGHWGIITIQSDHVIVNRPARIRNLDCASQPGVLWKLELTNLLTKITFYLLRTAQSFGTPPSSMLWSAPNCADSPRLRSHWRLETADHIVQVIGGGQTTAALAEVEGRRFRYQRIIRIGCTSEHHNGI